MELIYWPYVAHFRREKADLLGFQNYAYLSLDSKMADSPSEVWKMIKDLQSKSKTGAKSELQALQVTNAIKIIILIDVIGWQRNNDCDDDDDDDDDDDNFDGGDNGDDNGDNSGQWSWWWRRLLQQ